KENSNDYNVQFVPLFNRNNPQGYFWEFGDGVVSTEIRPLHKYDRPGKYNVCLTIESNTGCYSKICNVIDFSENPFRTQVTAQQQGSNTILFSQPAPT